MEAALEMKKSIVLPSSFTEIDRDEMMYVEGGRVPTWVVSAPIDAFLLGIGVGWTYAPIKALGKLFGRKLVNRVARVTSKYAVKFANMIAGLTGMAINMSVNKVMNTITNYFWSFTSLGGIIAFLADGHDGKIDGYIG